MDVEGFAPVGLVSGAELVESRLENSVSIYMHRHLLLNHSDLAHFAIEPFVLFLKALRAVTDQRSGQFSFSRAQMSPEERRGLGGVDKV